MSKHIRFDWAMKRLLRQKANFDVLEGFLSVLLKQDIFIEEILESESNQEHESAKFNRVDILVKNSEGHLMLIEVQNEREHDYFHRMNFGQAKLVTEHIQSGDTYANIKRVYSINIVYFDLGQGDDYVYVGNTDFKGIHTQDVLQLNPIQRDTYHVEKVSELFTVYYLLKVNRFDDKAHNSLDEWIYFLKNSEIPDAFSAKGLPEAKEKLRLDDLSVVDKEVYDTYLKEQRIRENELQSAQAEGEQKAREAYAKLVEEERRQKEEERRQKEEALAKEQEERRQKEEERHQKEEERRQKEEALAKEQEERRQKEEAQANLRQGAKMMIQAGISLEQISASMGLSLETLEDLKHEDF